MFNVQMVCIREASSIDIRKQLLFREQIVDQYQTCILVFITFFMTDEREAGSELLTSQKHIEKK